MNDIYLSILNHIKDPDSFREWKREPFKACGKTMATNGYCLVAVPEFGDFPDQETKVKLVYPKTPNMDMLISREELKEKLREWPTVDCFDEIETECEACYGTGEVDFEFYHDGKTYELPETCPVCEGEGEIIKTSTEPNGEKELDYTKPFEIGSSSFNVARIEELIFIADTLNQDIKLVFQTDATTACLFSIGEVDVLLAPTAVTGD